MQTEKRVKAEHKRSCWLNQKHLWHRPKVLAEIQTHAHMGDGAGRAPRFPNMPSTMYNIMQVHRGKAHLVLIYTKVYLERNSTG